MAGIISGIIFKHAYFIIFEKSQIQMATVLVVHEIDTFGKTGSFT
jgi:hypothetical protein